MSAGLVMFASRLVRRIPFIVILLAACAQDPLSVFGPPDDTLLLLANQKLEITLQNVGPGEYQSPPAITSESGEAVLLFLDVAQVCPCPPAGTRQRFRFEGRKPGVATIVFQQSYFDRVITAVVKVH